MPPLENPKHEAFANHLARGIAKGKAYVQAGYSSNAPAATRLVQSPAVIARVDEIKTEIATAIQTFEGDGSLENYSSLKELGIDHIWIANAYKNIYEESIQAGQYAPANTAVANLQKMTENESRVNSESGKDENIIPIHKMSDAINAITGLVEAIKDQTILDVDKDEEMVDVTPPLIDIEEAQAVFSSRRKT